MWWGRHGVCECDAERYMGSVGGGTWEMVEEMSHILSVQLASVYFYPVLGLLCVKLQYSLSPSESPTVYLCYLVSFGLEDFKAMDRAGGWGGGACL